MKKNFFILVLILILPLGVYARENVTDWYIKDFHSQIFVNTDSSLTITERITADCGNCYNKHGIFRVLPTQINTTDQGIIRTPVTLISITDEFGTAYRYQESIGNGTITWKIGDPNITITGVHEYDIAYRVQNAVRAQSNFDELYWNLNGNYWQLETDNFTADIIFPQGANRSNIDVQYFAGARGQRVSNLASYEWTNDQILHFQSTQRLFPGDGITLTATMPKGIVTPYIPSAIEKYQLFEYAWFLIPILVFIFCFFMWKKYGDDPNLHRAIMAEYDPPDNLPALYVGMILKGGAFKNEFITAAIIQMASRGLMTITETEKKVLLFTTRDYEFTWTGNNKDTASLTPAENRIFETLFKSASTTRLSDRPQLFAQSMASIKKASRDYLIDNGYIEQKGYTMQSVLHGGWVGILIVGVLLRQFRLLPSELYVPLAMSAVIFLLFSFVMTKLTTKGAEAQWRTKGFHLYMDMAEKYRQQFYEKEGTFERLLPYAIAFDMTEEWIKKMRDLYGDERFAAMTPLWFHSRSGMSFDADSFSSAMSAVSTSISQSVSTSSGRGGGGFSGGGGGGGGGGGW